MQEVRWETWVLLHFIWLSGGGGDGKFIDVSDDGGMAVVLVCGARFGFSLYLGFLIPWFALSFLEFVQVIVIRSHWSFWLLTCGILF